MDAVCPRHAWPLSYIYQREGAKLLAVERSAAAQAVATVLITRGEADLFVRLAPECNGRVHVIESGVDTEYFAPHGERPSPYPSDEAPIVFTGAMDYWPNIDAVSWFAREVLPRLAQERPDARFHIVGMNPAKTVGALAADARVTVTGKCRTCAPYLSMQPPSWPRYAWRAEFRKGSRSDGDGQTGGRSSAGRGNQRRARC